MLLASTPYALAFVQPPAPTVRLGQTIATPPVVQVVGIGGAVVRTSVFVGITAVEPRGDRSATTTSDAGGGGGDDDPGYASFDPYRRVPSADQVAMLPASLLSGLVGDRTDENGARLYKVPQASMQRW